MKCKRENQRGLKGLEIWEIKIKPKCEENIKGTKVGEGAILRQ